MISGVGGSLQKQVAGTFTLYGANTYSGSTSIAAGALTFGNRALVGATTAVSVAAGATVGFGVGSNTTTYFGATDLNNAFGGTFPGTAPPTLTQDPASSVGIDTTQGSFSYAPAFATTTLGLNKLGGNTLTLTGSNGIYTGTTTVSAGTLQLGNGTTDFAPLSGNIVTNATLLYNLKGNQTYTGAISGTGNFAKTGPGTLTLSVSAGSTYAGSTLITGGTVKLAPQVGLPAISGVLYQIDASNASSVTQTGGFVTQVNDLTTNGNNFANAASTVTLVNGGLVFNGRNVLNFNNTNTATLTMTNSTSPETVFIVEKVNGSNSGDDGIFGSTGNDQDIRVGGTNAAPYFYNPGNNNDFTNGGSGAMYVNGVLQTGNATAGTAQLLEAYAGANTASPLPWASTSLSNVFDSRYFDGEIGEVVAFSTALSASDRQAVEAYLESKWFGTSVNTLPATTPLVLSSAGSLDLNGGNQQVASLADYTTGSGGTILNSAATLSVLTVSPTGGTTTFSGSIKGGGALGTISLVKTGAGTQVLAGARHLHRRHDGGAG